MRRGQDPVMHVRVGCEFRYRAPAATPTIWQVRPRPEGPHGRSPGRLTTSKSLHEEAVALAPA